MSIALVVTSGFGNGTLSGTIAEVVTKGYTIGEEAALWTVQPDETTTWTEQANEATTWTVQ